MYVQLCPHGREHRVESNTPHEVKTTSNVGVNDDIALAAAAFALARPPTSAAGGQCWPLLPNTPGTAVASLAARTLFNINILTFGPLRWLQTLTVEEAVMTWPAQNEAEHSRDLKGAWDATLPKPAASAD